MNPLPLDRVDGTVIAVRFSSENFTVASFRQHNGREISIVGDLAAIEEGQSLSLYGRESRHPKHGPQFRVEYFHTYLEQTREGIRRFLLAEVQGIGPAYAERLISYFYPLYGAEMLERLQEKPDQLHEVPGLGEARIHAITEALHEHYGSRQLLLKLYEAGVSTMLARTIARTYEERGVDPLRIFLETPYQMVHDVPGLGFETVDRLARQRGLPLDDEGRIQAAITHLLLRAYQQEGHLCLPMEPLFEQLQEMVPLENGDTIGAALEVLRNQGYLQIVSVEEELVFYLRQPWRVEEGLTTQILRLLDAPITPLRHFAREPERVRQAAEDRAGITLDATQRAAFDHALQRGICIITGGPGTGKSTLARLIVDAWEEGGLKVKLAAPTGRAARRLAETTGREATTIHRLLEWREGEFQRNEEEPIEAETLLIDESSMLDAPLAWSLCRAIPSGCRVLFMGDVDQLPSVGPGNVLHDLIRSTRIPVARLTQIHRQDLSRENLIVNLAHAINNAPPGKPIPGGLVVARRPQDGNVFLFDTRLPWARCT
nr:AAA family ATPase [Ardenticatenales bacterium]